MQIIKPLLIISFVVVLVLVFRNRGRASLRAGSRLAALALGAGAIIFVIDPNIAQYLAGLVGVVRGTDLVLYILVVVFAVTAMSLYFGQREARVQLQQLARRMALSDAIREGPPRWSASNLNAPITAGDRLTPNPGPSPDSDSATDSV
jgi:hypothetical protein